MIAVMNVDLVGSSQLTPANYASMLQALENYLETIKQQYNVIYSVYRGDEFQIATRQADIAGKLLLEIKLWLASERAGLPLQSTISLAFGPGTVTGNDPGKNNGDTYILAGRTLDSLKSGQLMINVADKKMSALTIICHQLSYILNRLNTSQMSLLYDYVTNDFPTHQSLAEKLSTSRQNISERLRAAGAELLPEFIAYTQELICEDGSV
ncbi:hypothetical protein HHX48_01970 [Salinimonas sp. HHU 13199]|uniref:Uncharacterized protein n=1 Tax=Salinimonas profundi TaxID=2729140 RepID=A0ABR8LFJ6_9ALTE|nr:hypothetical protein [Salinimonas profundi]MBD3584497.1 hypothetical protein [Salinimonas profundi]